MVIPLAANTFVAVILGAGPGSIRALSCPECGGPVQVAIDSWDPDTGEPHGFAVACAAEDEEAGRDDPGYHRWYQSDWQPVRDEAEAWARTQGFRVPT